jgi:uncharacterized protein (TIGR02118 family)
MLYGGSTEREVAKRRARGMVRMFYFLQRRPDVSPDEFHRYWREHHAPLFCNNAAAQRYCVRYEQIHAAPDDVELGGGSFDGVSVMWFDSADDVRAMRAHPEYREVILDGDNFVDTATTKVLLTDAEEVFAIPT